MLVIRALIKCHFCTNVWQLYYWNLSFLVMTSIKSMTCFIKLIYIEVNLAITTIGLAIIFAYNVVSTTL